MQCFPLSGILHAAGVLRDSMAVSVVGQHVQYVCGAKAVGASHLHACSATLPLEAAVFFSSITALMGNYGQAVYAAANAYLDSCALGRRLCGHRGTSIQIPAVSGAGMGASTFSVEELEAMGAITLDEFSTFLAASLAPVRGAAEHARAALTRTVLQYICQWLQHSMTDYLTVPSLSEILLVMESEKKDAPITPVDAPTAPVEPALSQALAPLSPSSAVPRGERGTRGSARADGVERGRVDD